jgi:hypothetical protein
VSSISRRIWATRPWISGFLPAPSTIVVFSLSIVIRLLHVLELDADVLGDDLAAGQDGDVLHHGLAAVTEARRLDGRDLQRAAELVDHERGQRLALDVLGDDEERLAALRDLLEHGQQDEGVLERDLHAFLVGHEVGRHVALVELHALDHVERGLDRLGLLDRDRAVLADLLHRLGDDAADRRVGVGRDRRDLLDLLVVLDRLRHLLELADDRLDGAVDAALDRDRGRARGHVLEALAVDRLGQHGGRGRAVAGDVRGLRGDLADHLGAHVLVRALELDLLGHGDAVLGHGGRAPLLVDHDVAAAGAEGDLDGLGEHLDAFEHRLAGLVTEQQLLGSHR